MEADAITTIISTVGFPIAACVALFWYINKEREAHSEEMKSLEKSLNENTTILMQLKEVISVILGKIENDK